MRTVIKTMIREEIAKEVTKENRQKILQHKEIEVEHKMRRYNSALIKSRDNREMHFNKEVDNEKFERQEKNLHQLQRLKNQKLNEREAEIQAKVDRALARKLQQTKLEQMQRS